MFNCVMNIQTGAGGRTRTGTVSPPVDFESTTSTNFITPANILPKESLFIIQYPAALGKKKMKASGENIEKKGNRHTKIPMNVV